jgi:integrase
MAVKSYQLENKNYYEVYVSYRLPSNPSLRAQRRKKGIETKGKAERLEKELLLQCIEEVKNLSGRGDKWSQIVDKFKIYKETFETVQQDTIDDYVSMLRIWTFNFWEKPISEISRADVRMAIENAKKAGKSNSYLTKILHTTGRVYQWAKDEGLCPNNLPSITAGITVSKVEERAPKILSWEQLQYFLQKAYELNNPWYEVWATAIHTGMRSGELYALKWASVDLEKRTILVDESFNKRKNVFKSTKSGQFRSVPINDFLFKIMVDLKNKSQTDFVLPRLPKWEIGHQAKCVQNFCSEIGLPLINFHTFRACFATHLLSQGVSLGQVMKCAGWAELKTVQKYNRLAGVNEKGATDCLNALAPVLNGGNVVKFGS